MASSEYGEASELNGSTLDGGNSYEPSLTEGSSNEPTLDGGISNEPGLDERGSSTPSPKEGNSDKSSSNGEGSEGDPNSSEARFLKVGEGDQEMYYLDQTLMYWAEKMKSTMILDKAINDQKLSGNPAGGFSSRYPYKLRAGSAASLTIPGFKDWALQTGIESLCVDSITLWRSRKRPFRHEFLVVKLIPFENFSFRDYTHPDPAVAGFNLKEEVRRGLAFRIDRGRRSQGGIIPDVGIEQAAVDMVSLMHQTSVSQLEGSNDICFTLRGEMELQRDEFFFLRPRLSDVTYCLCRAVELMGSEYKLTKLNCWVFAALVFQLMVILFHPIARMEQNTPDVGPHPFRKFFYGTQFATSLGDLGMEPIFNLIAIFLSESELELSTTIHENPFRLLFFGTTVQSAHLLSSNNMKNYCLELCCLLSASGISTEITSAGLLTILQMIIRVILDLDTDFMSNPSTARLADDIFVVFFIAARLQDSSKQDHGIGVDIVRLAIRFSHAMKGQKTQVQDDFRLRALAILSEVMSFRPEDPAWKTDLDLLDFATSVLGKTKKPSFLLQFMTLKTLIQFIDIDPTLLQTKPKSFSYVKDFFNQLFKKPQIPDDNPVLGLHFIFFCSDVVMDFLYDNGILDSILFFLSLRVRWRTFRRKQTLADKKVFDPIIPELTHKEFAELMRPKRNPDNIKYMHTTREYLATKILAHKLQGLMSKEPDGDDFDLPTYVKKCPPKLLKVISAYCSQMVKSYGTMEPAAADDADGFETQHTTLQKMIVMTFIGVCLVQMEADSASKQQSKASSA